MARVTDSPRSDDRELTLRWSGQVSLTPRILAVNIFALALLAGGFFYLDSYRSRIVDFRVAQSSREVRAGQGAFAGPGEVTLFPIDTAALQERKRARPAPWSVAGWRWIPPVTA